MDERAGPAEAQAADEAADDLQEQTAILLDHAATSREHLAKSWDQIADAQRTVAEAGARDHALGQEAGIGHPPRTGEGEDAPE